MIKYAKYLLIFICASFIYNISVLAQTVSCPASVKRNLAVAANYIKASYEIIDNSEEKTLVIDGQSTVYKIPNYSFAISIYNLTEDLSAYVLPTNGTGFNVYYEDTTDGIYTFNDYNFGEIYNYTITIKSDNDECLGTTIRTIKFTKPRYNAFSEFAYCQNSSNFYCQKFIGTEINIGSVDDFLNKIKVNIDNTNPNKDKIDENREIVTIIKNNWKIYILIFLVLAVLIVAAIFFIKKYKAKKGWKL